MGRQASAHGRILRTAATAAAVAILAASTASAVVAAKMDEYQAKAAFLYNFLKFVQWPPDDGPITVAVLGDDPFEWRLDQVMKGRSIHGRDIVVKRIRLSDDATKYHVLFVSPSEAGSVAAIIGRVRNAPVLTVGDTEAFVEEGGMVRFFVEGDRLRFQIHAPAVAEARLKVSAQLLSLAAR